MTDITVKLDINGNPAVTCVPPTFSANRGNQQVKWKPGGSQTFTFSSLTGLTNPPFPLPPAVTSNEVTVQDDDTGPGVYGYTISVVADANGQTYSTLGSQGNDPVPCIKNN